MALPRMPYTSLKQERWAHTPAAKAKGFPTAEFDAASKGLKLPMHAMRAERIKRVIHAAISGIRQFEFRNLARNSVRPAGVHIQSPLAAAREIRVKKIG